MVTLWDGLNVKFGFPNFRRQMDSQERGGGDGMRPKTGPLYNFEVGTSLAPQDAGAFN